VPQAKESEQKSHRIRLSELQSLMTGGIFEIFALSQLHLKNTARLLKRESKFFSWGLKQFDG